jgi:acyl-CoA dehydrogenase
VSKEKSMDPSTFAELVRAVNHYVDRAVIPAESTIEREAAVPHWIRREAADMGLFGYALPAEYGGLGCSVHEEVQLAIEFGRASLAFRSMFGTNNGIAGQMIATAGTEEQKRTYLPLMASGQMIASFALTEPEAGSDAGSIATTAIPCADGYRLSGTKRFITNAPMADIFVVFARDPRVASRAGGICAFLVDREATGLHVGAVDEKMGQAGALSADVNLDNVVVGDHALLGTAVGQGFRQAKAVLDRGRMHVAGLSVGLAQRVLDECVTYASARKQFGQTIASFQLIQGMVADMQTEIFAGRALVLDSAVGFESNDQAGLRAAASKYFCSEMCCRVADAGVQIFGGLGYMRGMVVERLFRDARLLRIYEGTSQIQQLVIARSVLHGGSPGRVRIIDGVRS